MEINFLPKTKLGKLATWLIVAFFCIILFVNLVLISYFGFEGGETFSDGLAIGIPVILAGICGICAFVLGLMSILKSRERSILVYLATVIGFLILIFMLVEFTFPH